MKVSEVRKSSTDDWASRATRNLGSSTHLWKSKPSSIVVLIRGNLIFLIYIEIHGSIRLASRNSRRESSIKTIFSFGLEDPQCKLALEGTAPPHSPTNRTPIWSIPRCSPPAVQREPQRDAKRLRVVLQPCWRALCQRRIL